MHFLLCSSQQQGVCQGPTCAAHSSCSVYCAQHGVCTLWHWPLPQSWPWGAFVAAGSTVGGVPERVLFGEKGGGAKGVLMGRGQAGDKLGGHEGCQHSMAWLLLLTE